MDYNQLYETNSFVRHIMSGDLLCESMASKLLKFLLDDIKSLFRNIEADEIFDYSARDYQKYLDVDFSWNMEDGKEIIDGVNLYSLSVKGDGFMKWAFSDNLKDFAKEYNRDYEEIFNMAQDLMPRVLKYTEKIPLKFKINDSDYDLELQIKLRNLKYNKKKDSIEAKDGILDDWTYL